MNLIFKFIDRLKFSNVTEGVKQLINSDYLICFLISLVLRPQVIEIVIMKLVESKFNNNYSHDKSSIFHSDKSPTLSGIFRMIPKR